MNDSNNIITQYWEFEAARKINLYFPPIIIIIGGIGNLLSFLVYIKKKYRTKVAPVYILSLSVIDTVNLFFGLLQYWIFFNFLRSTETEKHCQFMFFIVNFIGNHGSWCIVALTIDRFLAVYFPFWTKSYQTANRSWFIVAILGALAFTKNLHYIWTADFVYEKTTDTLSCGFGIVNKNEWVKHYQIFELVISSLLPFIIIIVLNTAIVVKMHRDGHFSKERRSLHKLKARMENHHHGTHLHYGLTVSLLLVSTVFVILVTPVMVLRLHYVNKPAILTPHERAVYEFRYQLLHALWYSNNAVNFFLYSLSGKTFRKDLRNLFNVCNERKTEATVNWYVMELDPTDNSRESNTGSFASMI